ncbi:DUF4230 domain-containing protein [uncultured Holdemanella sp.]|uniref:DUF4230 domain-containing protein n=1 Tax=uncultured Holdemanella sp. TaxID=1763549 RepID=UPI0025D5FE58|nr:DUF4230 domain-containing protein [uncultured Holdemanella sp.]
MKNFKKILFILIFILIAFISGIFFANKQTEPEITSTLIQNRIEQASDLVTTKYHYTKVGKFENSLNLNGWSIPLTNKYFILTFEGEIQLGTDLSKANIEISDSTIHVTVNKPTVISNSIDESSIEVYDETKNIFNPISVSDYKAFAVEQKEKALSEAKKKGLMKTAQENAKKSIKQIISIIPDTDDYNIEVTFKE